MQVINAIATILKVSENQVIKHTELKHVFSVSFRNLNGVKCSTFVSKRKINSMMPIEIRLVCGRRQPRAWIARLTGLCPTYRFVREFIEPANIEWGKRGMDAATFEITEAGIYHDSDGDYGIVEMTANGLEYRGISFQEADYRMKQSVKAPATASF